ncbi:MAG: saccharopine dehydrogenase family protein [Candidatus Hodarchaeales archaeon]|jgi:lysine 6-dehydrogenase
MTTVVILGAGMMGHGLAYDLTRFGELKTLTIADISHNAAHTLAEKVGGPAVTAKFDAQDRQQLFELASNHKVVISALPYHFNYMIAETCAETGANMVDLGGNARIVRQQLTLDAEAKAKGITIIPDLGLAPGMMTILTMGICSQFSEINTVKIRVGGLPQTKIAPFDYQLTFSPEGLINEYREPCMALHNSRRTTKAPLTELETITFPPPFGDLEAFTTSGGTSTLPITLEGKVRELDYKTIRYPGHCEKMRILMNMGLFDEEPVEIEGQKIRPRDVLSKLLYKQLPINQPDVVLAKTSVTGRKNNGDYCTIENQIIDYFDEEAKLTAMMRTTAFPTSIVALMIINGQINAKGALPAEIAVDAKELKKELKKRDIVVEEIIRHGD